MLTDFFWQVLAQNEYLQPMLSNECLENDIYNGNTDTVLTKNKTKPKTQTWTFMLANGAIGILLALE